MASYKHNNGFGLTSPQLHSIGVFLVVLLALLLLLFQFNLIVPWWVAGGFLISYIYFVAVNAQVRKHTTSSPISIEGRLFWGSLALRVLSLIVIMVIAEFTWQRPLYVGAVDTARYFRVASEVAEVFWDEGISYIYPHVMAEYEGHSDDIGLPIIIGLLFVITGPSVVIANLFIAIIGSFNVVLVYRIASLVTTQQNARLAGWLAAFMPLSLFFDVAILKETFVVFFSSLAIYMATKMVISGSITSSRLIILALSAMALFYFRTAAGAVIALCIPLFFIFNSIRKNPFYSWGAGVLAIGLFIVILNLTGDQVFILDQIEERAEHGDARLAAVEEGTQWQNLALGPILLVVAHFAPFPSMIELNPVWGHDITYYWIGGLVAWNILAYFALMGIWQMIRTQPRQTIMIWGFVAGYTLVLGMTAMFTQVRLGWNVMPMMMIPAAIALRHYQSRKHIILSLIIAGVFILAWNIFRGLGRGVL